MNAGSLLPCCTLKASAQSDLIFIALAHRAVFQMCFAAFHGIFIHSYADDGSIGGHLVHDGQQNAFHHAAQTAGTGLALDGLAGNGEQGLVREGTDHDITAKQLLV